MNRINGFVFILILSNLCSLEFSWAKSEKEQFDYPELMVVPRASERIQMEAQQEPSRQFTTYIPIQLSALATTAAGIVCLQSKDKWYSAAGIGVGGGWLLLTSLLTFTYHPYQTAVSGISFSTHSASAREQLKSERLAEEALQKIDEMGQILHWTAFLNNLWASVYMVTSYIPYKTVSQISPKGVQATAILSSFLPLIFNFHWHDVMEQHNEYKKKIYGPIANAAFFEEPTTHQLSPGLGLTFQF